MKAVLIGTDIAASLYSAILVAETPERPATTETQYVLLFKRSLPISPTISTTVTVDPVAMGEAVPIVRTAGDAAVADVMATPAGMLFDKNVRSSRARTSARTRPPPSAVLCSSTSSITPGFTSFDK
jgi:hypothetical protein